MSFGLKFVKLNITRIVFFPKKVYVDFYLVIKPTYNLVGFSKLNQLQS